MLIIYGQILQVLEMEKQQNNSEQIGALQTELQQLTERLEKVQLESQDKTDVSKPDLSCHLYKCNFCITWCPSYVVINFLVHLTQRVM